MSELRQMTKVAIVCCYVAMGLPFLSGCASGLSSDSRQGGMFGVHVSLRGWRVLRIKLENLSSTPVELRASKLPWEWRYSMWVKAFENDALGSSLDERLPVADVPTSNEAIAVLPGRTLQGSIDLADRFPELEEVLEHHDVVLFWSYAPDLVDGRHVPRLSGSLTIPRS